MAVRFVVFGDTKGKDNGINKKVLEKIMLQVKKLDKEPDFFVVLGDTVAGSVETNIHKMQMENFKTFINSFFSNKVVLPVVGNHEVNIEPEDETYEKILRDTYISFKQHGTLEGYNNTVYYMDLQFCRFIVLNCYHFGEIKKIINEQLRWFEKVSALDNKFKILLIHCPPFPTGAHLGTCLDEYSECRDELWNIIDRNNIDVVFAGHEHNYSRRILKGNYSTVTQVVAGGGGEKLRDSFKSKEGVVVPPKAVYHFLVADIEAGSILVRALSTDGKVIDEFEIKRSNK